MALTKISTDAVKDDAVTSGKIADGAVGTTDIAGSAVTEPKIGSFAVTSGKIAADAVTTVKLADDAVTADKLAANAVVTASIANDAVTGVKIAAEIDNSHITSSANIAGSKLADDSISLAKLEHGTSSNDGKFLRANNGADPTFETVTGTTINNNANNRVITGSGTANTLEGESGLTFDSSNNILSAGSGLGIQNVSGTIQGNGGGQDYLTIKDSGNTDRLVVKTHGTGIGNVGIGTTSPSANLHLKVTGTDSPYQQFESASYSSYVGTAHADNNLGTGSKAGNLVLRGQTGVAIMGNNGTTTQVKIDSDGLKFNNDTAAANALHDYEEGTWTPDARDGSLSYERANYTKIGRLVYLSAYLLSFSDTSTNDSVTIQGLPFTSSVTGLAVGSVMYQQITDSHNCTVYIGTTGFIFYGGHENNYDQVRYNEMNGNSSFYFQAWYMTNS